MRTHFVEGGRVTIKYAVLEKETMSISPPMIVPQILYLSIHRSFVRS